MYVEIKKTAAGNFKLECCECSSSAFKQDLAEAMKSLEKHLADHHFITETDKK